MSTIYWAAPLFTAAEQEWNLENAEELRREFPEHEILLPQEFCAPLCKGPIDYGAIFQACIVHLERADLVIAVLDGTDVDSGTAFEVGYANARKVPIIGIRTDLRSHGEDIGLNCMLRRSCLAIVTHWVGLGVQIRMHLK